MSDPRKISRPRTVNQILIDRSIRHGIYLVRLAGGEANWTDSQMASVRRAVTKTITPLLSELNEGGVISAADEALMNEAATRGSEAVTELLERLSGESLKRLGKIAIAEADFEKRLLSKAFPIEMNFNTPSDRFLMSLMETEPIAGKSMRQWFSDMKIQTRTAINDQIRQGMIEGESINEILRRVRGRRENGFKDGIIGRVGENAKSIVRSGVMRASNRARNAFHMDNIEVVKGFQWILTLDDRTCSICVDAESQNPYLPSNYPEAPAHIGCRCVVAVITPSWEELGYDFDELEPGMRASMNGEVPDTMTYQQWFEGQSAETQMDILGQSRYDAFKNGADITSFSDRGQILTLEQLRAMEPDLFS